MEDHQRYQKNSEDIDNIMIHDIRYPKIVKTKHQHPLVTGGMAVVVVESSSEETAESGKLSGRSQVSKLVASAQ